ncbi:MAG TPA: amidohydrolase [Planctomycetaceae bacterium]|nr:amidohydrolase [Planctomycetaceae bacterium]
MIAPMRAVSMFHSVVLLAAIFTAPAAFAEDPKAWVGKNLEDLQALYRQLHSNPELSFEETKTAARLADELRKLGVEVTTNVGRRGVVGLLKNGPGPTVMIRTDLDALPVTEATGLPYASKVSVKDKNGNDVGVMHACGHDIHITCLVGTARYLAANKSAWRGTVMFIGQPAEEIGAGASEMLKDGLFTKFPKPDYGLALHVDSHMQTGKVGYRAGYILANVDSVDITMRGKGGHGAYPHTTIDPIVQAAQLVMDLQTIVSRENSPFEPAVVTVGSIRGGTKHNIIPDTCRLQLTVRSYSDRVRKSLLDAIKRKANAVAAGANAPEPIIEFSDATPATRNDERLVERLVPVFNRVLGAENVVPVEQSMGGEDFSQYGLAGVPIFMFRLGSVSAQRIEEFAQAKKPLPSLHSAEYFPVPEPTIATGVTAMSAAVLDLLPAAKK